MSINMPLEVKVDVIRANLKALHLLLAVASERSLEALQFMEKGERNGAMGTVLGLDDILTDAKALYGVAVALHRMKLR